jgi:hypothetical protein
VRFYLGIAEPAHAVQVSAAFLSVSRLRRRVGDFPAHDWIMDSGAFTEVTAHGGYRAGVADYAAEIRRWRSCGNLQAAVAQDYMCEPFALAATGLSLSEHQSLTVQRFRQLAALDTAGVYVMPVLQGYAPDDYRRCVDLYGSDIPSGAWVGVGSVCKRNATVRSILEVLSAIKGHRSDLRLHGFGLKTTALSNGRVFDMLHSADSMAWSFAARREGRNANDPAEGIRWASRIGPSQLEMSL